MKFTKPPLSQQKLIDLMSQRGLQLNSADEPAMARRVLDRVGYFRLSGFMLPFVHGGGGGNRLCTLRDQPSHRRWRALQACVVSIFRHVPMVSEPSGGI